MLIISGMFFIRYEAGVLPEGVVSIVASAALDFGLFFLLLLIACNYFNLIGSVLCKRIRRIYFSLMAFVILCLITLYDFEAIFGDPILVGLLLSFVLIYFFFGDFICDYISSTFPLRDNDRKIILLNDPPRERIDLVMFDVIICIFIIMPIIIRIIWL